MQTNRFVDAVLLAFTLCACGGDGESTPSLYSKSVTELVFEIDYEQGAEPFTGTIVGIGDAWSLFERNIEALFSDAPKQLTIPNTLEQMEGLGALEGEDYTTAAILDIAAKHRSVQDSKTRRSFYILYLDGYFNDNGTQRKDVIGVSIGTTSVIAMFKPVISGAALSSFVEQMTLIHEFGHAAGLVDNGIPAIADHHDTAHGAHCKNTGCVMYYLNEGIVDLVEFAQRIKQTGSVVVFGKDCLDDATHATTEAN